MNIEGLDYNTSRPHLALPGYGREVQRMIDDACQMPNRAQRQGAARAIIEAMACLNPQTDERKLWDHLAVMSHFQLDIDWPEGVATAMPMASAPEKVEYPAAKIAMRQYGKLVDDLIARIRQTPDGPERDELVRLAANQMRRCLLQDSHSANEHEHVAADLERLTNGEVRLNLNTFRFDHSPVAFKEPEQTTRKRRRR